MLDWLRTGLSVYCACCPCYQKQTPAFTESTGEFSDIEDGDMLIEAGVQRTLELIRQMMNQSSAASSDYPPPNYQDFNKYPLSSEHRSKAPPFPSECFADPVSLSLTSIGELNSRTSVWNEPYPKPSGQPPPVPMSWFRNRLATIRRSLANRFSLRQQPAELPQEGRTAASSSDTATITEVIVLEEVEDNEVPNPREPAPAYVVENRTRSSREISQPVPTPSTSRDNNPGVVTTQPASTSSELRRSPTRVQEVTPTLEDEPTQTL